MPADPQFKWYLAGPMSGIPECNYPAFDKTCKILRELGYNISSPHENFPVKDDSRWLECLRHDLRTVTECQGIILMEGWTKSRGARLELHIALSLEMPVMLWRKGELVSVY